MNYKEIKRQMRSGALYLETDPQINKERVEAKELLKKYNDSSGLDLNLRNELLQKMFGSIESSFIEPPLRYSYGKHVFIGKGFYANFNLTLVDDAHIYIGDHVLIAPNVVITTAGHPENPEKRKAGWQYSKDIHIGNNVWIGAGSIIHPGVTIGDNTIIGSHSVVTHDIPENVVAFGIPCKVQRPIDITK